MVTGNEEIKYGYLLDPCFQIVNTGGRPLTQGWIEVYIAGTRNKYYCSSDFAGTLHPFKIPLDSLGSNIILADVEKSYDVYVYNRFGNLAMSRYNITPGKGGAGGSISGSGIAEHWIGKNGQNSAIPAGTDTALKLPLSYEYEGSFIDRINENRTAFYLKEGLYLVQAVVNFKQSDQSLTNEISQVDVFTRSDDTPEDMSFNRDMAGPDSSDDSHCLKVSFIRCVKEDDEVSQIVLFKVNTPNAWSECYLQNVQIARLSSGGAGAGGAIYTAGEYIAIDDETNTISVTGIEPENYATHDEVEQAIESATSAFITSADLPDLSSYATEQWVLDKHYITSADIPDIPDDLVTSAELAQTSGLIEQDIADLTSAISDSLAEKMDKSSSADFYPRYDNPEGYLTSIPSEYVTESEMSGYVQDHTSGFLTSADLPDVSDMATKTWVTDQHYITSADVPPQVEYSAGDNIDITDHVVSVTDTSLLLAGDNVSITPSGNDYIISAQVPETSGYVTEQEMNEAIQSATSGKQDQLTFTYDSDEKITSIDGHGIAGSSSSGAVYIPGQYISIENDIITATGLQPSGEYLGPSDLNGYATETYVQDQTSAFITSADLPDVSDMATKTWVGQQGYLTSVPSEYVTESELNSAVSGKADKSEIPSLQGYATEQYVQDQTSAFITSADLPDVSDMATQTWVGEQGYLTEVPSQYITESELTSALSGYATESYVQDETSAFITSADLPSTEEVQFEELDTSTFVDSAYVTSYVASQTSGKQDQLSFEYNADNAISAINGSALAGGSSFDPSVLSSYIPYSATSIAAGSSNTASSNSVAIGNSNKASTRSLALGQSSSGSTNSIGIGYQSNGTNRSVSVGQSNRANDDSISVGSSNNASTGAGAIGTSNRATMGSYAGGNANDSNWCSFSQGDSNTVNGNSIAVGMSNSATSGSVAVGMLNYAYSGQAFGRRVNANHGLVIGEYNYDSGVAFGIGRGTGNAARADIFRINQSGDAYKVVGSGEGTSYKYLNEYDLSLDQNNKIVGIDGYDIAGGTGGVTEQYVQDAISSGTSAFITSADLPSEETVEFKELDLSTYVTSGELSGYATESWVNQQGFLTEVPSTYVTDSELSSTVSGLATKSEVTSGLSAKQNTLTGITDVEVVQSLPASAVSTVLYLIPEA